MCGLGFKVVLCAQRTQSLTLRISPLVTKMYSRLVIVVDGTSFCLMFNKCMSIFTF